MLCQFLPYSKVNHYTYTYVHCFRFCPRIGHYRVLSRVSSLCYTVGSYYISVLCIVVCICQSRYPNVSLHPHLSPLGNHTLGSTSMTQLLFCK